jgi:AbiV family abortive infection protein
MQNRLYLKAAKAAYENSLALFEDAKLLYRHKRYPRAYALSVLSCEEFAKAFLYKCIACGFVVDPNFSRDLDFHELKLAHLAHILSMAQVIRFIIAKLPKAIEHDKKYKEHSEHIAPSVFDRASRIDPMPLIDVLRGAHYFKILALYVDIKDGNLLRPTFMKKRHVMLFFIL